MLTSSFLHQTQSLPLVLLASFGAGVLASLTPCLYPMIPITMGVITAQKSASMMRNFLLSLSYGLGIASIYTVLGYLSATSHLLFGQWMAKPLVIVLLSLFFVYLAFSLFGYYELYVPPLLASPQATRGPRESLVYSFTLGLVTGTAASPCLTPALALLLSYAAQQENPLVGAAALFSFALGLSSLLILLATFSGSIALLPRAGGWMTEIKYLFAFMLIGAAVSLYEPLLSDAVLQGMYYAVLAGTILTLLYRFVRRT